MVPQLDPPPTEPKETHKTLFQKKKKIVLKERNDAAECKSINVF